MSQPSPTLIAVLRQELRAHLPFSQLSAAQVDALVTQAEQRYYAPEEVLTQPSDGPTQRVFFIRQGSVSGTRGLADVAGKPFEYEAGDVFPLSAAVAQRAVSATYRATSDVFVLVWPVALIEELARAGGPFADFVSRRILSFLDQSRRALQVAYSSQTLAEQSLETPLAQLIKRAPAACSPETPIREALQIMQSKRVGSMLVTDDVGAPVGIVTRYDVLGRITLAGVDLGEPMSQVMVSPLHTLPETASAQDAALLMSRHSIRHVPITRDGSLVGVVSERDLFALQRLSLKNISTAIRSAQDTASLPLIAADIRRFARSLIGQGVQARQLTALISHLNDVLGERLVHLEATRHSIDLAQVCWLALGSEGRSEQTIATDQDNALILADGAFDTPAERERIRAFADAVNVGLDAAGYPLCQGGVMAREVNCCMNLREWRERFTDWVEHGAPEDLLNASIFFDFRPLAGNASLAQTLRAEVNENARRTPRFLKQLALNALTHSPPLNWLGGIDVRDDGSIDLKMQGTALVVDAARVFSLAHGVAETNTRARLQAVGEALGLEAREHEAWASGFEFLQMLRLRAQLDGADPDKPNDIQVSALNDIDRRVLKESLRVVATLQDRLKLDYDRS
jgi:CBS domain-containing protein